MKIGIDIFEIDVKKYRTESRTLWSAFVRIKRARECAIDHKVQVSFAYVIFDEFSNGRRNANFFQVVN